MAVEIPEHDMIPQIMAEMVEEEMRQNIKAIAIVWVKADGSLGTQIAFTQGEKFPIMAGLTLLHHDIAARLTRVSMTYERSQYKEK